MSQSAGETVGVRFAVLSLAREYRGRDETDERADRADGEHRDQLKRIQADVASLKEAHAAELDALRRDAGQGRVLALERELGEAKAALAKTRGLLRTAGANACGAARNTPRRASREP